jgi:glycosyltransferase involved in cell wall biosynthesis
MGKVSVIIPAYNSSRWIAQTISSVQKQTYSNLEIIVVNDGSTDHTVQIVKTINDPRLSIYCQAHIGVSAARNVGIEHATGEFIAFLDADDLWREDMIENHVAALQDNPWAGVAYCWCSFPGGNC